MDLSLAEVAEHLETSGIYSSSICSRLATRFQNGGISFSTYSVRFTIFPKYQSLCSYMSKVEVVGSGMDDKYNVRKSRKAETFDFGFAILDFGLKKEKLLAEKQAIQAEVMEFFARYERLKL